MSDSRFACLLASLVVLMAPKTAMKKPAAAVVAMKKPAAAAVAPKMAMKKRPAAAAVAPKTATKKRLAAAAVTMKKPAAAAAAVEEAEGQWTTGFGQWKTGNTADGREETVWIERDGEWRDIGYTGEGKRMGLWTDKSGHEVRVLCTCACYVNL